MTTLFGTPDVKPKRQFSMLPILTVLFLFSYGLMTLLIVEQGSTIQSQRTMIQLLLGDSTELSAIKAKAARQQALAAQAPTHPPVEAPTAQAPSTQAPTTQAEAMPSEKAIPGRNHGKAHRPAPQLPPVPASDISDARRALMSI